jgi:anti-anti-sigma factor
MAQQNPRIKVSTQGKVTIAEMVDKKILDEISIAEISRQLERLVAGSDKPRIALDFASVAHMSSSMLGKLITLNKHVRERQGHMRLCNVQPAIYEVFVITRLSEVFHVTQTREQAVAELEAA